jgi:ankyrin repeat protein
MLMDAGFPLAKWRASLLEQVDDEGAAFITSFDGAATGARGAATVAPAPRTAAVRTTAAVIDWKALGPYPTRSRADAARLLHTPGADNDPTEYMWDALRESEPQRLAIALQAGADVRAVRTGSLMTALHYVAMQCDPGENAAEQLALVEQLLAAGADVKAVDVAKETPLIAAAGDCSIGMVRALITAGAPLSFVSTGGNTALKAAIVNGRADVIEALIDAGVDPRKEPYNAGRLASGDKAVEAALKRRRR